MRAMTTDSGLPREDLTVEEKLKRCEEALGITFHDRNLLQRCLTHSSTASHRLESNERLEFLGDAILGMLVCELLFLRFPSEPEGELTRLKSALVSRSTCAKISRQLNLQSCLLVGKGLLTHNQIPPSVLAAVFEALVAGVYLDRGFDAVRELVQRLIEPELMEILEKHRLTNFKSLFQQLAQKEFQTTPEYRLLDEKGPDHSKCFKISAVIGSRLFPPAWGRNKKQAEQRAAGNALAELEGRAIPYAAESSETEV